MTEKTHNGRKMRKVRTGQSNSSSSKDPTKSVKEGTRKDLGRGRAADSDLARNSGRYERNASPPEKETLAATAWSSPTRLAVAKERRNKSFLVRSRREQETRGSKEPPEKKKEPRKDPK